MRTLLVPAIAMASLVAGFAPIATQPDSAICPEVRTGAGALCGLRLESGSVAFLGVPYAAPPVGELRWRPPEPVPLWEGIREATSLAPACPQPSFQVEFHRRVARRLGGDPQAVPEFPRESEDCLYLNVWTPRTGEGTDLPVLVWIHGGAGTIGTAMESSYNGERLADRRAIVVAVNYRLGPLGFLAHPALSAESPRGVSGNYALLDLIEALRWVRREIAAFGGDPGRVTVFGQSAGAALIGHLMTTPLADGLFQRAILQSGTGIDLAIPLRSENGEVDSGEDLGVRLVEALGVHEKGDVTSTLRAMAADEIIRTAFEAKAVPDRPVIDGWVVPEAVEDALAAGRRAAVPVIAGGNSDETAVLVPPPASIAEYRDRVREAYGRNAETVLRLYPAADSAAAVLADRRRATDEYFSMPARLMARYVVETGGDAWLYRFDRSLPAAKGHEVGAYHGAELWFLFGNYARWAFPDGANNEDDAFGGLLADLWLRFAETGDPNGPGLPTWPAYDPARPRLLFLRDDPTVGPVPRAMALDLLLRIDSPAATRVRTRRRIRG